MSNSVGQERQINEIADIVLSGSRGIYKDYTLINKEGELLKVKIKRCGPDELDEIIALQNRVYEHIDNKDTFVLTTAEELSESLVQDVCLGVYDGSGLIAFTLMVVNRLTSRNLGSSLGYEQPKCLKCVTNDTTFVDQGFKGYGMQRHLLKMKLAVALKLEADEMLATVSPENTVSLSNLLSEGFEIASEKNMYGGFKRYIMKKEI